MERHIGVWHEENTPQKQEVPKGQKVNQMQNWYSYILKI